MSQKLFKELASDPKSNKRTVPLLGLFSSYHAVDSQDNEWDG